jgi:hypothetical protein
MDPILNLNCTYISSFNFCRFSLNKTKMSCYSLVIDNHSNIYPFTESKTQLHRMEGSKDLPGFACGKLEKKVA